MFPMMNWMTNGTTNGQHPRSGSKVRAYQHNRQGQKGCHDRTQAGNEIEQKCKDSKYQRKVDTQHHQGKAD